MTEQDTLLRARLNSETARIPWQALQRHFARGVVIRVLPEIDLVEVATAFAADNRALVEGWLASAAIAGVTPAEALAWHERGAVLWAVVVAPYVLVQDRA